jgi:hypothetical protein
MDSRAAQDPSFRKRERTARIYPVYVCASALTLMTFARRSLITKTVSSTDSSTRLFLRRSDLLPSSYRVLRFCDDVPQCGVRVRRLAAVPGRTGTLCPWPAMPR